MLNPKPYHKGSQFHSHSPVNNPHALRLTKRQKLGEKKLQRPRASTVSGVVSRVFHQRKKGHDKREKKMTKVEKEKKKQAWGSTGKKIMYGNWLRSNAFNETYARTLSFDGVKSTRMSDAASWPFVDNGTERGGKWHIKKKLGQRRPAGCPPNKAKWLTIPKMLGLIFIRCPFRRHLSFIIGDFSQLCYF